VDPARGCAARRGHGWPTRGWRSNWPKPVLPMRPQRRPTGLPAVEDVGAPPPGYAGLGVVPDVSQQLGSRC
jgi:hypothetical protein